jgi:hypothetical protein
MTFSRYSLEKNVVAKIDFCKKVTKNAQLFIHLPAIFVKND